MAEVMHVPTSQTEMAVVTISKSKFKTMKNKKMSKTWLLKKVLSMTKFLLMREVARPRLLKMK
jgi:hypothetical protein